MPNQRTFEQYPLHIPLLYILFSLVIYGLGASILSGFGLTIVLLYILYCLWTEYRVLGKSCRYCCYYGRLCGTGKGLIVPLFFKKGEPRTFTEKSIGWRDLIPDLLVFLIPFLGGIVYLFINFNLLTIALLIAITILALPGSGFMRSYLLCPNCRQRELGCPAEKLFRKTAK